MVSTSNSYHFPEGEMRKEKCSGKKKTEIQTHRNTLSKWARSHFQGNLLQIETAILAVRWARNTFHISFIVFFPHPLQCRKATSLITRNYLHIVGYIMYQKRRTLQTIIVNIFPPPASIKYSSSNWQRGKHMKSNTIKTTM